MKEPTPQPLLLDLPSGDCEWRIWNGTMFLAKPYPDHESAWEDAVALGFAFKRLPLPWNPKPHSEYSFVGASSFDFSTLERFGFVPDGDFPVRY